MPRWYDALLTLLAEQPPEVATVTLTLVEIEALAAGPLPPSARTRGYWWDGGAKAMSHRLAAIGWRVAHVRGRPLTLTFVRRPSVD